MQMPPVKAEYFPLRGGLNLVTPVLTMPDGMARDSVNFDVEADGGYRLADGYEAYDGRTAPSSAQYYALPCTLVDTVTYGDTVTGTVSGATGVVVAVRDAGLVLTKVVGSFTSSEGILADASLVATNVNTSGSVGNITSEEGAQYKALAASIYRQDIDPVPGTGAVLGVWLYDDGVYAFRNNTGNTKAVMWKATTSGWDEVILDHEIAFSNANTSVQELDTLTQGSASAAILKIIVETGSLASGVNTGRLIISTPTGGTFAAGAATSSGSGALTLSGGATQITFPPYGKYSFVNHNFFGSEGSLRMYGVNGVGRAFEFDGTTVVPIETKALFDRPLHIAVHTGRLVLAIDASLMISSATDPRVFDAVVGGAEIAVGEDVTALLPMLGSNSTATLGVFSKNRSAILYGSSVADYNLAVFTYDTGAYAYSALTLSQVYFLDELGMRQVSASLNFGNFQSAQLSSIIRPWVRERAGRLSCSAVCRSRSQIRYYFNEGSVLHVTVDNDRIVGFMPMRYAHTFNVVASQETDDGDEIMLAGGTDGYVYRLNRGTSFDGQAISAYVNLNFNHSKSPRGLKRYRKAVYEITGTGYAAFSAGYELGYASSEYPQGVYQDLESLFGSVYWDAFVWDNFFWDGRSLLPMEQTLDGTAENISLIIKCSSTYVSPFTISSVILHHTPRRQLR